MTAPMDELSPKDRRRLRQFLELAHSTSFDGEREAALGAATRLADSYGLSLREAVGMSRRPADDDGAAAETARRRAAPRGPAAGAPFEEFGHRFGFAHRMRPDRDGAAFREAAADVDRDAARMADEKRRYEAALADAYRRGLDAAEIRAKRRAASMAMADRARSTRWRPRAEFIRVLLKETGMTAREIAATAGVTIYDVFREKLLLRRAGT
ncbi:MAG: DUF2786 domain-containing protein [Rhodospirillaceae bacterium]|nr:DUF2786 domain-containing protein [Rhodospirillaceae bacterium]